jgi:hypothetical protein
MKKMIINCHLTNQNCLVIYSESSDTASYCQREQNILFCLFALYSSNVRYENEHVQFTDMGVALCNKLNRLHFLLIP